MWCTDISVDWHIIQWVSLKILKLSSLTYSMASGMYNVWLRIKST